MEPSNFDMIIIQFGHLVTSKSLNSLVGLCFFFQALLTSDVFFADVGLMLD